MRKKWPQTVYGHNPNKEEDNTGIIKWSLIVGIAYGVHSLHDALPAVGCISGISLSSHRIGP